MQETLLRTMQENLVDGQLPCAQAIAIASRLDLEPAAIGLAANQAGIRISRCQLGLFGYGPKAENRHKIVHPLAQMPPGFEVHLYQVTNADGIPCAALWDLAASLSLTRLEAACAAESLGVRVSHCQLGCFPRPRGES
jgi:hypothetical protein